MLNTTLVRELLHSSKIPIISRNKINILRKYESTKNSREKSKKSNNNKRDRPQ